MIIDLREQIKKYMPIRRNASAGMIYIQRLKTALYLALTVLRRTPMNVTIDTKKCTGCLMCKDKCSGSAFRINSSVAVLAIGLKVRFDESGCIDCMACTEPGFCPSNAVEVEA